MRVNRLLEITTLLLQGKTIPARQFAGRFDVSVRTIYRDVEALSAAGVPVYMTQGKGGGIALLDTFQLDRALLSEDERASLLVALKTLQATQFPEAGQFLARLEALFHAGEASDWVWIEYSPWGSKPDAEGQFTAIKHAILKRQVISFDYVDARGERTRRLVEPMQVIFKSQAWYVWGFCRDRQDFRTFRLSRMKQIEVTPQTFERRAGAVAEQTRSSPPQPILPFKLRFTPEVTQRVYDDFSDELVTWNADGSCQVTIGLVEDEWVYGFLLSYGCYVEVLEPAHVRAILVERMQRALRQYGPPIT